MIETMTQEQLWNGHAGSAWVALQETLDRLFRPFETALVDAVVDQGARNILDIGCGTGATTIAIARALGDQGRATGGDLSQPMIDLARRRAAGAGVNAQFVAGDAARIAPPTSFDMAVSRFGIMFFADPVAAFVRIRGMLAPGAQLTAFTWRARAENPFMTCAERAAAPLLPPLPAQAIDAPGQFAFADPDRVKTILTDAGWSAVALTPIDATCEMPATELDAYLTQMGRIGVVLQQLDAASRAPILSTLRQAFAPFVKGEIVRFTAACWRIDALA